MGRQFDPATALFPVGYGVFRAAKPADFWPAGGRGERPRGAPMRETGKPWRQGRDLRPRRACGAQGYRHISPGARPSAAGGSPGRIRPRSAPWGQLWPSVASPAPPVDPASPPRWRRSRHRVNWCMRLGLSGQRRGAFRQRPHEGRPKDVERGQAVDLEIERLIALPQLGAPAHRAPCGTCD